MRRPPHRSTPVRALKSVAVAADIGVLSLVTTEILYEKCCLNWEYRRLVNDNAPLSFTKTQNIHASGQDPQRRPKPGP
jgi:hypothetical protein